MNLTVNPLTPPNSIPTVSPQSHDDNHDQTALIEENEPLKQLTETVERNIKPNDNEEIQPIDSGDERKPKINSHGKVKTFRCKQCSFVAIVKLDFWEHMRLHIKPEKLLTCPKCPFITEYKHHLEYHLNNHTGAKPFKCTECSYTCVNKSMLNSHMKSHSNIYQYRCADCGYVTKYCHSLKVHLRKYEHRPAMVLNPDGTPNPLPIIDVYGTRRGPRNTNNRSTVPQQQQPPTVNLEDVPSTSRGPDLLQMMMAAPRLPFPYSFLSQIPALSNPLWLRQFADQQTIQPEILRRLADQQPEIPPTQEVPATGCDAALDLSRPEASIKTDSYYSSSSGSDEEEEKEEDNETSKPSQDEEEVNNNNNNDKQTSGNFVCPFCTIAFGDVVLYTMHMGYHGFKNPFTCNMCGEECSDKISFFLHIARTPHT